MKILLPLIAVCLTACSPNLTVNSAPISPDLLAGCGNKVADPLTTGDQYDTARALGQAIEYGKSCKARQASLAAAIRGREQLQSQIGN